jgi:hypothetical protein
VFEKGEAMRFRLILASVAILVLGVGVTGARASHAPVVDPTTVPAGLLAAHVDASDLDISRFARAIKHHEATLFVQHVSVAPNSALGWHTHPGPALVAVVKGSLGYQREVHGECVTTWYEAGTGFMDPGFGHVHRGIARGDGFEAYVTFVTPTGSPSQTIPADPPAACS